MGQMIGDTFEDFGSAPECVIDSIPCYEILGGGLVRIFVCKTIKGRVVLDHTDVMTRGKLVAIGTRLLEIAEEIPIVPETTQWVEGRKAH